MLEEYWPGAQTALGPILAAGHSSTAFGECVSAHSLLLAGAKTMMKGIRITNGLIFWLTG